MQQPLSSATRPSEMCGQAPHPHEVAAAGLAATDQMAGAMAQGQRYAPGPAVAPTDVPQSFGAFAAPQTHPTNYLQGMPNVAGHPFMVAQSMACEAARSLGGPPHGPQSTLLKFTAQCILLHTRQLLGWNQAIHHPIRSHRSDMGTRIWRRCNGTRSTLCSSMASPSRSRFAGRRARR